MSGRKKGAKYGSIADMRAALAMPKGSTIRLRTVDGAVIVETRAGRLLYSARTLEEFMCDFGQAFGLRSFIS